LPVTSSKRRRRRERERERAKAEEEEGNGPLTAVVDLWSLPGGEILPALFHGASGGPSSTLAAQVLIS